MLQTGLFIGASGEIVALEWEGRTPTEMQRAGALMGLAPLALPGEKLLQLAGLAVADKAVLTNVECGSLGQQAEFVATSQGVESVVHLLETRRMVGEVTRIRLFNRKWDGSVTVSSTGLAFAPNDMALGEVLAHVERVCRA